MGNACCSHQENERDQLISKCEPMQDVQIISPQLSPKLIKVGPEIFIALKKGDIYAQYQIGQLLGEGAYGMVSKVTHRKTGMVRAMKSIMKDTLIEEEEELLFSEMNVLKDLDHPNIVRLYELYQDDYNYYLITEFLEGGELFERIKQFKKFTEVTASALIRQVISCIAYCHSRQIVHRDLKPENLIFTSQEGLDLKVIDFGTSRKIVKDQKMTKRLGTPYYIAPEVLAKNYDQKCDIWSCGVILFILLVGYPPFNGRSEAEIYKKIQQGQVKFREEDWGKISESAKELVSKMLEFEPEKRYSAEQVLEHPWMQLPQNEQMLDLEVIQNLTQFAARSKFKQTLLTFMASQMISQKDQEHLQAAFKSCDKNGDGTLSREELIHSFTQTLQSQGKLIDGMDQRIMRIIEQVDINLSGQIDYTEFIIATFKEEQMLSVKRVEQAFSLLDLNSDLYISQDELQQVMEGMDDDIWAQFLSEVDYDKDGKISKQEFIKILMSKV